ncbi:AraC family transcriptional regulator [Anaerocolumna cellulosilytica]|uniref:AraC family transcriptional regulator n=1 Tax=Anaerocolumna cellulosilytica TaxID=433286 RepID=A0A6S6QQE3_9FIRM|nr:AraC family transcriptional regulator [Anaerocolumna cellulosilytica]MBB5197362.1 AraC-like DNA-binding protein/mannose-6-phosphate isomerase-like protein (cupin superfamily) [Anaerocolumna cellulosilytica]BCJ92804.1 AraC family transcriptional regulator [Anaerocolumna cellulosilytica]
MDLYSLDKTLRTVSKSEEKYKHGHNIDIWNDIPKVKIENTLIPCLNFTSISDMSSHNMTNGWISTLLEISVKKNSRFNPVPVHVHDFFEINYVYSGVCPQNIDGRNVILKEGQVLIVEPYVPHSIGYLDENDIMISFLVSKKYLHENLLQHFSTDSILSHFFISAINAKSLKNKYLLFLAENSRRTQVFTKELLCECFSPSVNSTDFIRNLFSLIVAELINVYKNQLVEEEKESNNAPILSIVRYIETNFRNCTLESVSQFFHLSPNYLTTLIKKNTGMTYKQLVQSQKLKHAAKYLSNTSMPVSEVAYESGYENVSFFYKKFQEQYKCSPHEFRKNSTL